MKTLVSTLLLSALVVFGQQGGNNKKAPSQAHVLTNAEFDALLAHPDELLIIDVRRPDEITANGGFPVYLSIQNADLAKSTAWIPKDRTIVTVSNHAARGGGAADILTKAGFKVAGTIGAQTYEQAGGKIAHIVPPAPRAGDGRKQAGAEQ
jgi:rhodanese-related sulfurtransferase